LGETLVSQNKLCDKIILCIIFPYRHNNALECVEAEVAGVNTKYFKF